MGFFDFLSGGDSGNPAKAAQPYLNKAHDVGNQYYDPYVQRGEQANQQSNQLYQRLAQDPSGYFNELMQGYKPSAAYQGKYDRAFREATNSANAGGYAGTELDQEERGRLANRLSEEDLQQYINNILGLQGTGLEGLQHQGDYGYQASQGVADYLGNSYGNQAENAYAGKAQQLKNQSNTFSDLLKGGAQAAGAYFTGGASLLPQVAQGLQSSFGQQGLNNAGDLQQAYSNYGNNRYANSGYGRR